MIDLLKYFIASLVIFLALDFLWLGVFAKNLYKESLGDLMRSEALLPPAIFVYILLALGLAIFILWLPSGLGLWQTFFLGVLYGLVVYGVYEGTNMSVVKDWPLKLFFIDIVWGMGASGVTAVAVKYLSRFFL